MDTEARIIQAVRNNSEWCDAICRAHNVPGKFHEAYWINHGNVPPYTSRLITLAATACSAKQLGAIRSLIDAEPESFFSVKDAFQCLDLAPLGFGVLFHATWIYRASVTDIPVDHSEELEWSVVGSPGQLDEWERAWRGSPANSAADEVPRVFVPSLLKEPGLHFLAGRLGDAVVATGAINRTGGVVGLSNVFSGTRGGVGPLFPGCVRLAHELYPGLPVVGYERGEDLMGAEKAGFTGLAGLTVWQRTAPLTDRRGSSS